MYSAGPAHYLASVPGSRLYGSLSERVGRDEKRLFPGAIAMLLAVAALWPPTPRQRVAYAVGLLVAIDLSFDYIPAFRGLRAPARAGGVALLMIAVLAGFGWARLGAALRRRAQSRWQARAVAAAGLAAIAAEYAISPIALVRAPTQAQALDAWLASRPDGVVAELPMPREHELPGAMDE